MVPITPTPIRPASFAPIPIAPVVFSQSAGLSGGLVSAFTSTSSAFSKEQGGVMYPHRVLPPHQEIFPHFSQQQQHGIVLEHRPVVPPPPPPQPPAELSGELIFTRLKKLTRSLFKYIYLGPTPPKKRRSPTKHRTPGDKDKPKEPKEKRTKEKPIKKEKSGEPVKTPKKRKGVGDTPTKSGKAAASTSPPKKLAKSKTHFPIAPPPVSLTPISSSSSSLLLAPSSTLSTPSHVAISKINETISTLMQKTSAATPSEKEKIKAHHSSYSHHQSTPQFTPPFGFKSVISETAHYSQQQVQTPPREK
jgi:hypothetical protein